MKKILLKSQQQLIKIKRAELEQKEKELNRVINLVAIEFGIPENELRQWKLSDNDEYLEPVNQKLLIKTTIPSKKKNKKK